jgi:hypothetical protein
MPLVLPPPPALPDLPPLRFVGVELNPGPAPSDAFSDDDCVDYVKAWLLAESSDGQSRAEIAGTMTSSQREILARFMDMTDNDDHLRAELHNTLLRKGRRRYVFSDDDCTEYARACVVRERLATEHPPSRLSPHFTPRQSLLTQLVDDDQIEQMLLARALVQWKRTHGRTPRDTSRNAEESFLAKWVDEYRRRPLA